MNKILSFLTAAFLLSGCAEPPSDIDRLMDSLEKKHANDTTEVVADTSKPITTISAKRGDAALLKEINENEPSAKDVVITSAHVLYVAVYDDGTPRRGLAEYYCQLANEYSSSVRIVKIVKFGSMKDPNRDNAYGILLGESSCDFGR